MKTKSVIDQILKYSGVVALVISIVTFSYSVYTFNYQYASAKSRLLFDANSASHAVELNLSRCIQFDSQCDEAIERALEHLNEFKYKLEAERSNLEPEEYEFFQLTVSELSAQIAIARL